MSEIAPDQLQNIDTADDIPLEYGSIDEQAPQSTAEAAAQIDQQIEKTETNDTAQQSSAQKSQQQQKQQQPIRAALARDPAAFLKSLEQKCSQLTENLTYLAGGLQSASHATSGMTTGYIEVYQKSMSALCDSVDTSVDTMQQFVDHCLEMNKQLYEMRRLYAEIKTVRKLVEEIDQLGIDG